MSSTMISKQVVSSILCSVGLTLGTSLALGQPQSADPQAKQPSKPFHQVNRRGSVDLAKTYDLGNMQIPRDEIHTLLPRDAIPSLTDPKMVSVKESGWIQPTDRIIEITINNQTVGVPINILNYHEVVNFTLAGEPVAATFCPLCDSATVISRNITRKHKDGSTTDEVLEFGVSGALYNSNVLMYDRTDMGLWSQLGMEAVSGPLAGTRLKHYPIRIVTWREFSADHPSAKVVSRETGHQRDYTRSPYGGFLTSPNLLVPVNGIGDKLPKKTLGLGIFAMGESTFIPADLIGDGYTFDTSAGPVHAIHTDAGIDVTDAPEGVLTAQAFYYSWSAFHPDTAVITNNDTDHDTDD